MVLAERLLILLGSNHLLNPNPATSEFTSELITMAQRQKHSLVSIPRNQSKAKHFINWWNLNLDLKIIVGKPFDGAANMNGVHKGLSTRMEECSPLSIYVHCYGHVFKLVLQDTMTQILEPGSVQLLRRESQTTRPVRQHRSRRWRSETDAEVIECHAVVITILSTTLEILISQYPDFGLLLMVNIAWPI